MQCENTDEWSKAMDDEIGSLIENKTFELIESPENKKAIKGKWVYASKMDANGETKCKARYVAKGFTQQSGIDYEETFSPTANMSSLRMLMQASVDGWMELGFTSLSTAQVISRRDRNPEPGRNSLLFRNSSKGSFCCSRTIGSPPQRRTFI